MKRKFFDIGFIKSTGMIGQTPRVLKYLVENRNTIIPYGNLAEMAQNIRLILKTPMAEFFDRIISSKGLGNFIPLYLAESGESIPELLAQTLITLDLKQIDTANVTRSLPMIRDRVIVNLSSIIRQDKNTGRFTVSSVDSFLSSFVKSYLVASYNDSDDWLSPYLGEFTVRTYSMILSSLVARYYNLTQVEALSVMAVCALFMSQMLGGEKDDPVFPALFRKCTYLGTYRELAEVADLCKEYSQDGLDLEKLCECIIAISPSRLSTLTVHSFTSLTGNLGPDSITSHLALEYPPYWIYILLLALSGNKIPIVYQLNNMRLAQEGRSKFLQQLMTYDALFTVNRG